MPGKVKSMLKLLAELSDLMFADVCDHGDYVGVLFILDAHVSTSDIYAM